MNPFTKAVPKEKAKSKELNPVNISPAARGQEAPDCCPNGSVAEMPRVFFLRHKRYRAPVLRA